MKNKRIRILFLVFTACLLLSACNKQLNVLPTTSEVDGNIITDLQSAKTALNGVYFRFANASSDQSSVPNTQWYDVMEGFPSQLAGLATSFGGSAITDHSFTAADYGIDGIWNYGYNLVNAANGFMKNLESTTSVSDDAKKEMMGEAKFLRAFANATLLLYYGQYADASSQYGIILRSEFVKAGEINLPRSTVAQTYTSILADLDDAIASLPTKNSQIYYANVWAAKLLKARLLINRGGMDDYATVVSLTQDIIANSPFSLEANVKDIFLSKAFNSNEVIMGIQPYQNGGSFKYETYLIDATYAVSDSLVSLIASDPRNQWYYKAITLYGYFHVNVITKYYPGSVITPAVDLISDYSYAFRLTEAYLLEAEALVASGGSLDDAKTLLKTIMGHAGIIDFAAVDAENTRPGLQLMIIKEEMKNFFAEGGQDWLAVRRLPFATLQMLVPAIQNKDQLLLPIPQTEITRNGKIAGQQNPGY
ncbi:MAG: RagB/SusD family nutrient uptake outer membrane protein [Ferruginibacter sp.]